MFESHFVDPYDVGINNELLEGDPRVEPKNNNFRFFSTCSPELLLNGIEVELNIKSNLSQCKYCLMNCLANNNIETKDKDLLIYLGGGIPFLGGTLEDYYNSSALQTKKFIYGILIYPFSNEEINKEYTNLCEIQFNSHRRLIIPFINPNNIINDKWNFGLCNMECLLSYLNNKGENSEILLKASAIAIRFPPLLSSLFRVINRKCVTGRDIITICSTYYTYFFYLINPNGNVLIPPEKIFDYSLQFCNLLTHVNNIPETIPMNIILLNSANLKPEYKFLAALNQPKITYFWEGDKKNFSFKNFKFIKIEKIPLKAIEDANKYFTSFTPIDPHNIHSDIGCSIIKGKDHCYFYVPKPPSGDKNKIDYDIIDPLKGEHLQMSLQEFASSQEKNVIDQGSSLIDTESIKQVIFLCIDISDSMNSYDNEIPSSLSIAMQYLFIFGNNMYSYRIPCLLGLILFNDKTKICCPLSQPSPEFGKKDLDFIRGYGGAYIWKALSVACDNLVEFTKFNNDKSKFPNSKNRIIVISNGRDSSFSGISFMEVTKKLIDNKIIVDTVFVNGNKSNDELVLLTHLTGGLALNPSKLDERMSIFEEEAFLDINEREIPKEPIIPGNRSTYPLKIKSTQITSDFLKEAIENVKYDTKIEVKTNMFFNTNKLLVTPKKVCFDNRNSKFTEPRKRRILRELHLAALTMDTNSEEYDPDIAIYPFQSCFDAWDLFMKIPNDIYLNKWFSLYVAFPEEYPFKPPIIRFLTAPYHLNVSKDGRICIETLENDYLATFHVIDIIKQIKLLFLDPKPTIPIDIEKLVTYTNNYDEYKSKAIESSILAGKDNFQDFIKESKINDQQPDFQLTYDSDTDVPEYMKSFILKRVIKKEPKKIVLKTQINQQETDTSNENHQTQTKTEQQNENDAILPGKIKLSFQIENEQKLKQKCNEFMINIKDFTIKCKLGKTDFAETNLVEHTKTSKKYVAKTIFKFDNDFNFDEYIFNLFRFKHPTIIEFIGFSKTDFSNGENPTIFMEYSQNGSLGLSTLPPNYFRRFGTIILLGVARSMMLLHKYHIVHGNLKLSNVLLNQKCQPCLTDFNISIINRLSSPNSYLYTAPEVLKNNHFSKKSDVYSFGLIMYKIITNKDPFSELDSLEISQRKERIINGYRPKFETLINKSLKYLIERCWSNNPYERPSFEEIFFKLAYDKDCYIDKINPDQVMKYVDLIKKDLIFCTVCNENIEENELLYYSGYPYHKKCIECMQCHKKISPGITIDDFIYVTPGLFMCEEHYNEYLSTKMLPENIQRLYHEKILDNLITEIFNSPAFNRDNILNYHPDELLIDSNMIENSFKIDIPYESIIPSAKFHFDKSPNEVNFDKLRELLDKNAIIYGVEAGSIILKIAFLVNKVLSGALNEFNEIMRPLKNRLNSALGRSIIGNFVDSPIKMLPDDQDIKNLYNMNSINILQNTLDLDQIDFQYIKEKVNSQISEEDPHEDWIFLLSNKSMFEEAENQIRKDIENNSFEMIITGETIFANKYFEEYEKIKEYIPSEDAYECFLYHGSDIKNHAKIVKEHFYMPGENDSSQRDPGYFGIGIYATENPFYAAVYGAGYHILKINEKTSIICCRAIYNKSKVNDLKDLSFKGKAIPGKISYSYGIHHGLVGNSNSFHPITRREQINNLVVAEEFVFANKFQIIPICSFTVMRTNHLIVWKDENIENDENTLYMKHLSKRIQMNVYFKKSLKDALKIVETKKHNQIKLITNGGRDLSGKKLIEKARQILQSNFVCLVFARDTRHMKWISKMENVLFTTDNAYFRKFAELNMNKKDVLDFIELLEIESNCKFNINEEELLNFPLFNQNLHIGGI